LRAAFNSRRAINVGFSFANARKKPATNEPPEAEFRLAVLCVNQFVNRCGDARTERNEQQLFPWRVRECANVNHAGARFGEGRLLN
jgi:hypothetical protein